MLRMTGEPAIISVDEVTQQVADAVAARLEELVADWLDRMWQDPDFAEHARPELREPARLNARSDIGRELSAMTNGCELPVSCPEEVRASARMAARNGFPLTGVMQSYRTGHAVQWDAWHDAVDGLGLAPEQRRAVLDRGSSFLFEYADRCSKWAAQEYTAARESLLRSTEQRRTQAVRDLLAGQDAEAGHLDYPVDADHLAAVAWGRNAEQALDVLAAELEGKFLKVAVGEDRCWGWLAAESWEGGLRRTLAKVIPPDPAKLAIGGPASGVEGFRIAHDQAEQARRIGERRQDAVTLYQDVGMVALAVQDERRARGFVEHELGGLSGDDARSKILRHTLRTYLGTGQNASSAAALLDVHERTIANRIKAIEERLGLSVATRSSELDTALRLEQLLAEPSPPAGTGSPLQGA